MTCTMSTQACPSPPSPSPPSPPSGPSLAELITASNHALVPEASSRTYNKYYIHFINWLANHNLTTNNIDGTVIAAYVEDLSHKYKANTITSRISGIKSILLAEKGVDLNQHLPKATVLLNQKAKLQKTKRAAIFTRDQILKFLRATPHATQLHYKMAVMFQWFGGLRKSEAVYLTFSDIDKDPEGAFILVRIPRSKTDAAGVGTTFYMMRDTADPQCCPVAAFDEYVSRLPSKEGRFFLQCRDGQFSRQVLGKSW